MTKTTKKPVSTKKAQPTKATPAKKSAPPKKKVAAAKKSTVASKTPATQKPAATKKSAPAKTTKTTGSSTAKPNQKFAPTPSASAQAKSHGKKAVAPKKKTAITTQKEAMEQKFEPYHAARGESYMNTAQRDHFRHILNQWKQDLMEEVDRTMHHMKDESASLPDPADRATQEEEFSFELRARDRERKLIKKIEESLEAIDHNEYGYCETCGVEIGVRRLEARPTATLCIDCKTLDEIKEKQTKG